MENSKNTSNMVQSEILALYKKDVFEEIKAHWNELYSQPERDGEFYKKKDDWLPWFGNMWEFFFLEKDLNVSTENDEAYFEKNCLLNGVPQKILKLFPKCFRESFKQLACELDYLFPDTCNVKKFFPVIATAYIFNRRIEREEAMPSLISELYYGKGSTVRFDRRQGLLQLSKSKDLPAKEAKKAKKAYFETSRQAYVARIKSFIFLSFLIHTRDICNVTASLLAFEEMTNCLKYSTKDMVNILKKAQKENLGTILEEEPFKLKNRIYKISLHFVSSFWECFSGFPLYEFNKENFESFRADCKDVNNLPSDIAKVFQKKYEELTITEKVWIMQLFYRDFSLSADVEKNAGDLTDEDFRFLDDFHKEIFGERYLTGQMGR